MRIRKAVKELFVKILLVILFVVFCAAAARFSGLDIREFWRLKYRKLSENDLEVHFIDVGQGDSIFIRSKEGVVLIDTGTDDSQYRFSEYLRSYNVKKVDCLVITHPHSDHIGGARRILEDFPVGTVMMCESDSSSKYLETVLNIIDEKGIKLVAPLRGDVYGIGNIRMRILSPPSEADTAENDGSIVMRVEWGETTFLLAGDAESEAEARIIADFPPEYIKSDVLKVGHHGSYTSTSDEFLDVVKPEWAVISCGYMNLYSHPHSEVLRRLKNHGVQDENILRTDERGDIVFLSDGKKVRLFDGQKGRISEPSESESHVETDDSGLVS